MSEHTEGHPCPDKGKQTSKKRKQQPHPPFKFDHFLHDRTLCKQCEKAPGTQPTKHNPGRHGFLCTQETRAKSTKEAREYSSTRGKPRPLRLTAGFIIKHRQLFIEDGLTTSCLDKVLPCCTDSSKNKGDKEDARGEGKDSRGYFDDQNEFDHFLEHSTKVMVVHIIVGGLEKRVPGKERIFQCLTTAESSVRNVETLTPLIVIAGSGGLADILAFAWRFLHDQSALSARLLQSTLTTKIKKVFNIYDNLKAKEIATRVLNVVAVSKKVVVFDAKVYGDFDLDKAILGAIVQNLRPDYLADKKKQNKLHLQKQNTRHKDDFDWYKKQEFVQKYELHLNALRFAMSFDRLEEAKAQLLAAKDAWYDMLEAYKNYKVNIKGRNLDTESESARSQNKQEMLKWFYEANDIQEQRASGLTNDRMLIPFEDQIELALEWALDENKLEQVKLLKKEILDFAKFLYGAKRCRAHEGYGTTLAELYEYEKHPDIRYYLESLLKFSKSPPAYKGLTKNATPTGSTFPIANIKEVNDVRVRRVWNLVLGLLQGNPDKVAPLDDSKSPFESKDDAFLLSPRIWKKAGKRWIGPNGGERFQRVTETLEESGKREYDEWHDIKENQARLKRGYDKDHFIKKVGIYYLKKKDHEGKDTDDDGVVDDWDWRGRDSKQRRIDIEKDRTLRSVWELVKKKREGEGDDIKEHGDLLAHQELMIWAVVMKRFDMAEFFWQEGGNAILNALLCSQLFAAMADHKDIKKGRLAEHRASLIKCSHRFKQFAIGVSQQCYVENASLTSKVLESRSRAFDWLAIDGEYLDVLTLARMAEDLDFIDQAACQAVIIRNWRGGREHDQKYTSEGTVIDSGWWLNATSYRRMKGLVFAPRIKFYSEGLSFIGLMAIISYIVIAPLEDELSFAEYLLSFWYFGFIVEEMRETFANGRDMIYFWQWWNSMYNRMDCLVYILHIITVAMRIEYGTASADHATETHHFWITAVKGMYGTNLVLIYVRFFQYLSIYEDLGVRIEILGRLVGILLRYLVLLGVFIVAHGLASQAVLNPNGGDDRYLVQRIIYRPYFQIYGELMLDDINEQTRCLGQTVPFTSCSNMFEEVLLPLLNGLFLLVTSVMVLNMLIADFTLTFEEVKENSSKVHKMAKLELYDQFDDKSIIPKPFYFPAILIKFVFYTLPAVLQDVVAFVKKKKQRLWQGRQRKFALVICSVLVLAVPFLLIVEENSDWGTAGAVYGGSVVVLLILMGLCWKLAGKWPLAGDREGCSPKSLLECIGSDDAGKQHSVSLMQKKEAKKIEQFQDRCCDTYLEHSRFAHKMTVENRVARIETLMDLAMADLSFFKGKSFSSSKRKEQETLEGKDADVGKSNASRAIILEIKDKDPRISIQWHNGEGGLGEDGKFIKRPYFPSIWPGRLRAPKQPKNSATLWKDIGDPNAPWAHYDDGVEHLVQTDGTKTDDTKNKNKYKFRILRTEGRRALPCSIEQKFAKQNFREKFYVGHSNARLQWEEPWATSIAQLEKEVAERDDDLDKEEKDKLAGIKIPNPFGNPFPISDRVNGQPDLHDFWENPTKEFKINGALSVTGSAEGCLPLPGNANVSCSFLAAPLYAPALRHSSFNDET